MKVDTEDRFCRHCGYPLWKDRQEDADQRLVTVVFSDMSGYSTISEALDPGDLGDLMDRIFSAAVEVISAHGGLVEKFIGDAVVALFGARKAREDDPINAIRAALRIHRVIDGISSDLGSIAGVNLKMHTGINAGYVLLKGGKTTELSPKTLGSPINQASRLSDMAAPGEILIGEVMYTYARKRFVLEDLGRHRLKGFRKHTRVYRVVSERGEEQVHSNKLHGDSPRFIGRQEELKVLGTAYKDLISGRGAAISIRGEAGIGKSRLVSEYRKKLDDNSRRWYEARCFQSHSNVPYLPFSEFARQILGADAFMPDLDVLEKRFVSITGSSLHFRYLTVAMGAEDYTTVSDADPGLWKGKIFDTFKLLLDRVSRLGRTVFCIEDLHWADNSSMELLEYLLSGSDNRCPCIFILTHREGLILPYVDTTIQLDEFNRGQVKDMIASLTAGRSPSMSADQSTLELIYSKAGGNPFYVEELTTYLLEKGIVYPVYTTRKGIMTKVPLTVETLVSARLDGLDRGAKLLLQEASALSSTFSRDLLLRVVSEPSKLDKHMAALLAAGFIKVLDRARGLYGFKHEIAREVIYASILRRARVSLHARIAAALEADSEGEMQGLFDMLAYHYRQSGDTDMSLKYSLLAAERHQRSGSLAEALILYSSAERDIKKTGEGSGYEETLPEIWEGMWSCARIIEPDTAIYALTRLAAYNKKKGHKESEWFTQLRLVNLFSQKGRFKKAIEVFREVYREVKDKSLWRAVAFTAVAYTYTYLGRPKISLKYLEKARPAFNKDEHRFFLGANYITTLAALVWMADIHKSLAWYKKTRSICEEGDNMDIALMADIWLGYVHYLAGKPTRARQIFKACEEAYKKMGRLNGGLAYIKMQSVIYFESIYMGQTKVARKELQMFIEFSRRFRIKGSDALGLLYRAWILISEDRHREAVGLLEKAVSGLRKGIANRLPYAINALAAAYLKLGSTDRALSLIEEGHSWNLKNGNKDQLIWSWRIKGDIATNMGQLDKAYVYINNALGLSRSLGMSPHVAWSFTSLAHLFDKKGDVEKAEILYKRACRMWMGMSNPYQAERVGTWLGM